jgi:hypothetical protein
MITAKKRIKYNIRWQLSTPTLAIIIAAWRGLMMWAVYGAPFALAWPDWIDWTGAAIANLVGANLFIYIDERNFNKGMVDISELPPEIRQEILRWQVNKTIDQEILCKFKQSCRRTHL